MQSRITAATLLAITFVLGAAVGMLGQARLVQARERPAPPPREGPPGRGPDRGFVAHMDEVIQPHDSAQWARLLPHIESTDRRNRAIVDGARDAMRAALDSMRLAVAPLLDDAQRARLDDFARRAGERPPPGIGGRGRRGPPPP
jgi:hypothetical protein